MASIADPSNSKPLHSNMIVFTPTSFHSQDNEPEMLAVRMMAIWKMLQSAFEQIEIIVGCRSEKEPNRTGH